MNWLWSHTPVRKPVIISIGIDPSSSIIITAIIISINSSKIVIVIISRIIIVEMCPTGTERALYSWSNAALTHSM